MNDLIFDIKEFGLHDGAGMRTTVFLKGCPLRCVWCHNPEGQSFDREIIRNTGKCRHCGLCLRPCDHPGCRGTGACLKVCPGNFVRCAGEEYTPLQLAEKLLENVGFLRRGGVTFSGGEPLCHPDFILETISAIDGIKTAVETCGYVGREDFIRVTDKIDDIFMDIKLADSSEHKKFTGVDNRLILENAEYLMKSGREIVFRIPLIPSVTDTDANLGAIADFISPYSDRIKVEMIPYNRLTGAKYNSVGREYAPLFDESRALNKNTGIFTSKGIRCTAF